MRFFLWGFAALLPLAISCKSKVTEPGVKIDPPPAEVPAARPPSPDVRGTRWLLTQVAGRPLATSGPRAPYLQLLTNSPRVEGDAGCNRFAGEFMLTPEKQQLHFGPLLSTKMACPAMTTETAFLSALEATARYRIQADSLYLLDSVNTAPLATLRASKM